MVAVGSLSTWRNRFAGATDGELSTLHQQIGNDHALYPLVSDEVARRSGQTPPAQGADMTGLVSLGPTSNVRRQADQADMTKAFATTVLGAATAGMTEEAMKLYDQGVEQFGPAFRDTYYELKDQAEAADKASGPQPILNTVEPIKTTIGIPTSVVSPSEGERLASGPFIKIGQSAVDTNTPDSTGYKMTLGGMPSVARRDEGLLSMGGFPRTRRGTSAVDDNTPADYVAEPDRPRATGLPGTGQLPVVRDDALIKIGDAAGYSTEARPTGYEMKPLSGLPQTVGGKGGLLGAGGFPSTSLPAVDASVQPRPEPPEPAPYLPQGADAAVANMLRETELASTQYKADQTAAANAAKATVLGAATRDAKALVEAGLTPEAAVTEALKQPGVGEAVTAAELAEQLGIPAPAAPAAPAPPITSATAASPPPDMTGGYAVGDLMKLPVPAAEGDPSFRFRSKETVSGRTGGGVPRGIRPVVAPPTSGGIASLASPPPAPPPGPVANGPPVPLTPTPAPAPAPAAAPAEAPPAEEGPSPYWEALIQGGLATMASQNPNALGAIGEGGQQGVAHLGAIRKNLREDRKEKSEGEYRKGSLANQREGIAVQREGIASQDRRAAEEIQARKDLQTQELVTRNQLLDKQLSNALHLKGIEVNSQFALLNARGDIEAQLLGLKEQYEREGVQFKYDTAFDFLTKKAGLPKEAAGIMAAGFAPPKAGDGETRSPMGDKETGLAFDIAAGSILGEGATGQQLVDLLPANVKQEVMAEVSRRDDPSGGAAAVLGVLKKNNIVPNDTSWGFGLFGGMELKQAGPPATGSYTYVPGKGPVPK